MRRNSVTFSKPCTKDGSWKSDLRPPCSCPSRQVWPLGLLVVGPKTRQIRLTSLEPDELMFDNAVMRRSHFSRGSLMASVILLAALLSPLAAAVAGDYLMEVWTSETGLPGIFFYCKCSE